MLHFCYKFVKKMGVLALTKTDIIIIMAIARSKGGQMMKKKVIILDDRVAMYMRFSTEEQAKAFESKYLILHRSEAMALFEKLKNKLFKETKIPNLLNRRVDNNGIF